MNIDLLNSIRIVLVNTSHPGNIGATARAMRTMGFHRLYLVAPKEFPHPDAIAMASGTDAILDNAIICSSLTEAIGDCHWVIGTSARTRSLEWPLLDPRACAQKCIEKISTCSQQSLIEKSPMEIALVFGRESKGLSNEELQQCHAHVQIPTDAAYQALNIAAAVQILVYEIRFAALTTLSENSTPKENKSSVKKKDTVEIVDIRETRKTDTIKNLVDADMLSTIEIATVKEMEQFYEHLDHVLRTIQFIKTGVPNRIMPRLRRLFQRAKVTTVELNILRGILKEIEKYSN